ncbi:hypothetical protein BT69DRAFT_1305352, partial [Atractiella rhizophila]
MPCWIFLIVSAKLGTITFSGIRRRQMNATARRGSTSLLLDRPARFSVFVVVKYAPYWEVTASCCRRAAQPSAELVDKIEANSSAFLNALLMRRVPTVVVLATQKSTKRLHVGHVNAPGKQNEVEFARQTTQVEVWMTEPHSSTILTAPTTVPWKFQNGFLFSLNRSSPLSQSFHFWVPSADVRSANESKGRSGENGSERFVMSEETSRCDAWKGRGTRGEGLVGEEGGKGIKRRRRG